MILPGHLRLLLRKKRCKGFALVATVMLMLLLSLLCVGLLSLATSQIRIADSSLLNSEARAQCLLALDVAIGDLQATLGADQRVSAYSGILAFKENPDLEESGNAAHATTSFNPHILGVWRSWDTFLTAKSTSTDLKISDTYDAGRSKLFLRWLISSANESQLQELEGISDLGMRQPGRVLLLGQNTLGKSCPQQQYIYADLIQTPVRGQNKGYFAWWIGGENQKAKINLENEDSRKRGMDESFDTLDTTDILAIQRMTWNTPRPEPGGIEGLKDLPSETGARSRIISIETLPLATMNHTEDHNYYFDITTSSVSLPVNVRKGGLKHDLNLLLTKKDLSSTEFERTDTADCPIFSDESVQKGTEPDMPIGSWQSMHAWYHLWPGAIEQNESSGDRTAGLIGAMDKAYTRLGGSVLANSGQTNSSYDNKTGFEKGDPKAGYARTPVMLAFYQTFGLTVEVNKENKEDENETTYDCGLSFAPMFLWWNPYNIPMRIRGDQLYSHSIPYKTTWMQLLGLRDEATGKYSWGSKEFIQRYDIYGLGGDWGNYFRKSMTDRSGDIIFAPGEIIFFSHSKARSNDQYSNPGANPWIEGYNPQAVAGYRVRIYSNKKKSEIDSGKYYIALRLGKNADGCSSNELPYGSKTDSFWMTPDSYEAISVLNGYGSMGPYDSSNGGVGKYLMSPQRFTLGWYDPNSPTDTVFCDPKQNNSIFTCNGTQSNREIPFFVAAVGATAKTGGHTDTRIYPDKDYRCKSWQHSSPAFWGSMSIRPDDQRRQYHPFQLSTLPAGTGLSMCPIEAIGRNGTLGITRDGEQVSFASIFELPIHPPFSLAGFSGMKLLPGWWETTPAGSSFTGTYAAAHLRRLQYQSGVSGVGIGNSFADPAIPADQVYQFNQSRISTNVPFCSRIFDNYFDHGFLINDALWDRFFCSSISDMPKSISSTTAQKAKDVAREFFKDGKRLPVRRYIKAQTGIRDDDMIQDILSDEGWKYIAQYILIDGGFNINSTSVNAWYALLQGLQNRKLVGRDGDSLAIVERDKKQEEVLFSRFGTSTTTKSLENFGSYDPLKGADFRGKGAYITAWGEVRKLSPEQLRKLAEQIVVQVKKRGPFLNMADFVNRRLDAKNTETSLSGALQAAIDATEINSMFNISVGDVATGDFFKFPEAVTGSIHTAAPGYLIQSDVLSSIGNVLTVRDDTFTIRAYGCVKDKSGRRILAQAWCEATVQRGIEYVDAADNPATATYEENNPKKRTVSDVNFAFGRKFRIVSFRWLDAAEI